MRSSSHSSRGSTLLMVLILVTVLLGLVAGILVYAGGERTRAVSNSRAGQRQSCAESGLQLARSYYGRNYDTWNTYLSNPSQYDPVQSSYNTTPANPRTPALQTARPELFADVDGDGKSDVYLYIRDNEDEFQPLTADWRHDNDQVVVVGAVCISSTLVPRLADGTQSPTQLAMEGLLAYNGGGECQTGGCDGSNNQNNQARP